MPIIISFVFLIFSAPAGLARFRDTPVDGAHFAAMIFGWRSVGGASLHLEEAHHREVEALGGERSTNKKNAALIEADVGEVLKFALGGEAITATKLRAFERHQLE